MRGSKLSYMLMLALSMPFFFEAEYVLDIWLVSVPEHTATFMRIVLLTSLVDSLSGTLIGTMLASGRVKWYQIIVGGFSLLTLPLAYLLLRATEVASYALLAVLIMSVVCHFARLAVLRRTVGMPMCAFLKGVTLRCAILTVVASVAPFILFKFVSPSFLRFLFVVLVSVMSVLLLGYIVLLNKSERNILKDTILHKINAA